MARKMSVCLLDDMSDMLLNDCAMHFGFDNSETVREGKRSAGDWR